MAEEGLPLVCHDRAALMGTLSELFGELDADYTDGIRVDEPNYSLHIFPESQREAIRIAVHADDAAFARSLAISARDVAKALDL